MLSRAKTKTDSQKYAHNHAQPYRCSYDRPSHSENIIFIVIILFIIVALSVEPKCERMLNIVYTCVFYSYSVNAKRSEKEEEVAAPAEAANATQYTINKCSAVYLCECNGRHSLQNEYINRLRCVCASEHYEQTHKYIRWNRSCSNQNYSFTIRTKVICQSINKLRIFLTLDILLSPISNLNI